MRRLLDILINIAFVFTVTILTALTIAIVMQAVNARGDELVLPSGVVISDDFPLEKLPELVKHMNAKQFEEFAKARNDAAYAAAHMRHTEYTKNRIPQASHVVETTFDGTVPSVGNVYVGGRHGNHRTYDNLHTATYDITFPDMMGGGVYPVTIINPFCFEFWQRIAGD